MAFQVGDRVKETSTTTGTGTLTLAGAATGFQSFNSGVGDGNSTYYVIEDGTNWEVGVGEYTHSGTTLARSTIIASSNSNAAVSWSAGTRNVFVANPASMASHTTAIKTGNYTVTARDSIILASPSSGNTTITLPAASESTLGLRFLVKKVVANTHKVTVTDAGSAHVDHASNQYLFLEGDYIEVVCAYTNQPNYEWVAISKYLTPHYAKLVQSVSQRLTEGSWIKITLNTNEYTAVGMTGDTTNNKITIARDGLYRIDGQLGVTSPSGAAQLYTYFTLNGTSTTEAFVLVAGGSASSPGTSSYQSGAATKKFSAGDDIYMIGWVDSAGSSYCDTTVGSDRVKAKLSVTEIR